MMPYENEVLAVLDKFPQRPAVARYWRPGWCVARRTGSNDE